MRHHWQLTPGVRHLNHGSYGACPTKVLARQAELRQELESNPPAFMRALRGRLDEVRQSAAEFVGAQARDVGFVRNATEGVNAVVRSLVFAPGDEILTTDHTYGACQHTLRFVAERTGARVVVANVPFPVQGPEKVVDALCAAVTDRTRLALVDHVTSITGIVFPIAAIVAALKQQGVETLVDGAHAPGMVEVNLDELGAGYYSANFHKWVCAPKGAGMLWVRRDLQEGIVPPVISHGYSAPSADRFPKIFDWTGTDDPTAWLCVADALKVMAEIGGSWERVRQMNRASALHARDALCAALHIDKPLPDAMIGALSSVPLPPSRQQADDALPFDELMPVLAARGFEVNALRWPAWPNRVLRVSAQLYNLKAEFEELAQLLPELLAAESS